MLENERGPVPLYQERHRHPLIPLGDHGCHMQKQEKCWGGLGARGMGGQGLVWSCGQLKPLGGFHSFLKELFIAIDFALGADAKETSELYGHRA